MLRTFILTAMLLFPAAACAQGMDRDKPSVPLPPVRQNNGTSLLAPTRAEGSVSRGDRAPDFELEGAAGARMKLSAWRGHWVALCFCSRADALEQVDALTKLLDPERVAIVAVVAEKAGVLRAWTAQHPTSATLLADPTGDIASVYGAYDGARQFANSALVLVDHNGIVREVAVTRRLPPGDAARVVQYAMTGL